MESHTSGRDTHRRLRRLAVKSCLVIAAMLPLMSGPVSAGSSADGPASYWWHHYPSFASVDDPAAFASTGARMDLTGAASDPTWGPFGQRLTELDQDKNRKALKAGGARLITWIEGFGDCMLYAAAFDRRLDGEFVRRKDDPSVSAVQRNHWCWSATSIPQGNTLRWIGIHNSVNDEDLALPAFSREKLGIPVPRYPDGRSALGWLPAVQYPLNARAYDAGGAKDISGSLHPAFEAPAKVNEIDPSTGKRGGPIDGLYPAVLGRDDIGAVPGLKNGDTVYSGVISVHKDLSNPFWREYARVSVREILKQGIDGVWCDNYSPWDNFGYPPIQKAFGDWSVAGFHSYLRSHFTGRELHEMRIVNPAAFDVRVYLKEKAKAFGARNTSDPGDPGDPVWHDVRWLDDPVWCAYRSYRQSSGKRDLRAFYEAIHDEARKAGRPDFCIAGNDVPMYGLGWTRDTWLDMISTEVTPGWHMGTGSRGVMVPPIGKMAVVYRAALEHQKGPFATAWYYLNNGSGKYGHSAEMAKTLMCEGFANGTFLLYLPSNPASVGTSETHAWWNRFVRAHETWFGARRPIADVGILFSPDNQLALMTPGGFPDMDRQPHIFGHYGWATAMIDAHIPYRVVTDWKLDRRRLSGLRAFIVPDAECLSDASALVLEQWVRAGGRLIVTGPSGVRYGPEGFFRRRSTSVLAHLVGSDLRGTGIVARQVGMGSIQWVSSPVGMDYYLRSADRQKMNASMARMVGHSGIIDTSGLPSTVSVSTWRSLDGSRVFADLVNYNVDPDADRMTPACQLAFRLRLPMGWHSATISAVSPDGVPSPSISLENGWAVIRMPELIHFASVRLSRR